MIKAGNLDRHITIQRATTVYDEFNEQVETWANVATLWARRRDSSDVVKTELLGAEQIGAYLLTHFTIRSSALAKTITPSDQIEHDGAIWNIKGTKEAAEGRNRFIEITAVKENN
jgi:head-tail adaptor